MPMIFSGLRENVLRIGHEKMSFAQLKWKREPSFNQGGDSGEKEEPIDAMKWNSCCSVQK